MKVAFVTINDALDVNSWSGIPFYMAKAFIDAGVEVEFIGDLKKCPVYLSFRLKNIFYNKILKKKCGVYYRYFEPKALKYLASQVSEKMQNSNANIILSPGALPIAYLKTDKPVVLWTDATFVNMIGYYPGYSEYSKETKDNCHQYEKKVLSNSQLSCFSSQWAADSAIEYYKADPQKVKIIPFGANFETVRTIEDILQINKTKQHVVCELLFVGQEWERKGGDIAIKIAEFLNEKGIKTILHLVGIKDIPLKNIPDFVVNYGFLNKATSEGRKKIETLFIQSHFFILPTRADCTPMVFSEANSFGLPVITYNTGGIASVITDDVNGKMFAPNTNIEECAEYIKNIFCNIDQYKKLTLSSYNEYRTRLNWKVSVDQMISHMENILKK